MKVRFLIVGVLVVFIFLFASCKKAYTPKPPGYFRLDFPEKEYQQFQSSCPFTFDYPVYGSVEQVKDGFSEPCWYDVVFPVQNAKVHLTYKDLDDNLPECIEDIHTLVYKHVSLAEDIKHTTIYIPEQSVYGIIYDIAGNTATSLTFFVTDSIDHFLSGSLYFDTKPNNDSLQPAIDFFREDVVHLMNSVNWN